MTSYLLLHCGWDHLNKFLSLPRRTLTYCPPYDQAKAFVRSYKNLQFYWILGAGHNVSACEPALCCNAHDRRHSAVSSSS
ncbi:hypothetical protein PR202_gb29678 [Eleusine coracana subsp. coracana]|uniref:Uncharacterized protein n=1 Tax=Eleusine coracana subsp. coracana TaxID=191504 RepID=A0AAV5G094_ELECO|nr:hypothetical protein PR202_gb29678 [Eleusine coracana subsp. coracana]